MMNEIEKIFDDFAISDEDSKLEIRILCDFHKKGEGEKAIRSYLELGYDIMWFSDSYQGMFRDMVEFARYKAMGIASECDSWILDYIMYDELAEAFEDDFILKDGFVFEKVITEGFGK